MNDVGLSIESGAVLAARFAIVASLLVAQFPSQAKTVGRFVVFALNKVRGTAHVEPKHRIVQIQTRDDRRHVFP